MGRDMSNIDFNMLYHILIDRFVPAQSSKKGRGYKGGNLKGIISQLDKLQTMGVTGLLLTPFVKGKAYHGYHTLDFATVNPHFGSWHSVDELVDEVHRRGMTIYADFVANHCHQDSPIFQEHPEWFKRNKDGSYSAFNGIDYLPQFDLDKAATRHFMTEQGLLLCRHGFDGLRLDYAKGPSIDFWRYFRKHIKATYPDVQLIGEVWGRPAGKRLPSALAQAFRNGSMTEKEVWQKRYAEVFDGVLDFAFQEMLTHTVSRGERILENASLRKAVAQHFAHYADCPDFKLYLFLDNHDTNRFLYECLGNLSLLQEAVDFCRELPMPYILYYGTEKGMTNREDIFCGKPYADEMVRQAYDPHVPDVLRF